MFVFAQGSSMKIVQRIAHLAGKLVKEFQRPIRKTILFKRDKADRPTLTNFEGAFYKNPHRNASQLVRGQRRMVLVDGNDVANALRPGTFSVNCLEMCLRQIANMRNDCHAIVPQYRLKATHCSDNRQLQAMQKMRSVYITPGKTLNNRILTCNPRPFMLDIAREFNAAIVSNDGFEAERQIDPEFGPMLDERQIAYELQNGSFAFRPKTEGRKSLDAILGNA